MSERLNPPVKDRDPGQIQDYIGISGLSRELERLAHEKEIHPEGQRAALEESVHGLSHLLIDGGILTLPWDIVKLGGNKPVPNVRRNVGRDLAKDLAYRIDREESESGEKKVLKILMLRGVPKTFQGVSTFQKSFEGYVDAVFTKNGIPASDRLISAGDITNQVMANYAQRFGHGDITDRAIRNPKFAGYTWHTSQTLQRA